MIEEVIIDCRSEEGVTIGLIDALISIARVLSKRDLDASDQIREALLDLRNDEDIKRIIAELAQSG